MLRRHQSGECPQLRGNGCRFYLGGLAYAFTTRRRYEHASGARLRFAVSFGTEKRGVFKAVLTFVSPGQFQKRSFVLSWSLPHNSRIKKALTTRTRRHPRATAAVPRSFTPQPTDLRLG